MNTVNSAFNVLGIEHASVLGWLTLYRSAAQLLSIVEKLS